MIMDTYKCKSDKKCKNYSNNDESNKDPNWSFELLFSACHSLCLSAIGKVEVNQNQILGDMQTN